MTEPARVDFGRYKAIFEQAAGRLRKNPGQASPSGPTAIVTVLENRLCEARVEGHSFLVDEPVERGGSGKAPSAMEYFVAGAAACLTSQITGWASFLQVPFSDLSVQAELMWDQRYKHHVGDLTQASVGFIFRVSLASSGTREQVVELFRQAENGCYASDAVRNAVPMRAHLTLNGEEILVERRGTEVPERTA